MSDKPNRLLILTPPDSMRSGSDVLGLKTSKELARNGVVTDIKDLWSDKAYRLLSCCLPYDIRAPLYKNTVARIATTKHLKTIDKNTVVWIQETALPYNDTDCRFEKTIIKMGCPYIFHIKDDWFSLDHITAQRAKVRLSLADLVITATDQLKNRINELFPNVKVIHLEEPIDVERVHPVSTPQHKSPVILWSGNATNLKELSSITSALERAYIAHPFTLRVISGRKTKVPRMPFPVEFFQFDYHKEAELMAGSIAGLAPMKDSPYARCKGTYKVKTYMAAGLPTIASPVGYHKELISHAKTGFFANNAQEWTDYIMEALRNRDTTIEMGAHARKDAVERFSHENLISTWANELIKYFPQLKIN